MSGAERSPGTTATMRADLFADLLPLLHRVVTLDPRGLVRIVAGDSTATALTRLPFAVLVSRTVELAEGHPPLDVTVRAAEALAWLEAGSPAEPALTPRDAEWRAGLPPRSGWVRLDSIPDDVIRPLVRSGAEALKDAAAREGVPDAQPRAEVADALLDAVVLTVTDDHHRRAEVTLRSVSALTRMGFLARGGQANIETSGRWIRLVGAYGTVFQERAGGGLSVLTR